MQFLLMPTFIFKNYMISSSLIPLHKEKQVSDVSELEDLRIIMYQSFIHSFIHITINGACLDRMKWVHFWLQKHSQFTGSDPVNGHWC